jgi:hypothetical protein
MNKRWLWLMTTLLALVGCAERSALIREHSTSWRSDVFHQLPDGGPAADSAGIRVSATLKTHSPGSHFATDSHGTADYKLLLNIDGQAVLLTGSPEPESSYAMIAVGPEAGPGVRYRFKTRLRLQTGAHRVVVGLPDDGVAVEREVVLPGGRVSDLIVEPVYGKETPLKALPNGSRNFKEGIVGVRVTLNGKEL